MLFQVQLPGVILVFKRFSKNFSKLIKYKIFPIALKN